MDSVSEYELIIEVDFEEFITRFDIDEVLSNIDRIIESELFNGHPSYFYTWDGEWVGMHPFSARWRPSISYLGIKSISSGSLLIAAFIGGAVLTYVGTRFARGVDDSMLVDEIKRSGKLTGDSLAPILRKINNWAERYVKSQKELGGNITKIAASKKERDDDSDRS